MNQVGTQEVNDWQACISLSPDMPILGFSNSAANKDMMSKIWANGDTVI